MKGKKESVASAFGAAHGVNFYRIRLHTKEHYGEGRDQQYLLVAEGPRGGNRGRIEYGFDPIHAGIHDIEVGGRHRKKGVATELLRLAVAHLDEAAEQYPPRFKGIFAPLLVKEKMWGVLGKLLKHHGFEEDKGENGYGWIRPPKE